MSEEKIEEVKRALGEPVLAEFPENLRRTKRNLLLVSAVAVFAQLSGVEITEAGFLGFKFSNPSQIWLQVAVLCVVGYLYFQFAWQAFDYLQYSRIRVTGTRVSHVTAGILTSEYGDYPNDPRQSTLYNWWHREAGKIGNLSEIGSRIHELSGNVLKSAEGLSGPQSNDLVQMSSQLRSLGDNLSAKVDRLEKAMLSERVPTSLERFDRWFHCFSRSQVIRVVGLDLLFPLLFGGTAVYFSVIEILECKQLPYG